MLLFRIVSQNPVGTNEIHPKRHNLRCSGRSFQHHDLDTKLLHFRLFTQHWETPSSQNASGAVENMAGFEKFSL